MRGIRHGCGPGRSPRATRATDCRGAHRATRLAESRKPLCPAKNWASNRVSLAVFALLIGRSIELSRVASAQATAAADERKNRSLACERIDPESEALHRKVALECVAAILGAEVFLLALDGLLADQPAMELMEQRTQLLAARFAPRSSKKGARS